MNTDHDQQFAAWISQLRTQHGLTPQQLADQIGCSESIMQQIEAAAHRPARDVAERLADALHVSSAEREQFVQLAVDHGGTEIDQNIDGDQRQPMLRPHVEPPSPPIELIGREQERVKVMEHFRTLNHRLVTLVGPGGMGKTSLAAHVATALGNDPLFTDGAAMVWLAGVRRAQDVPLAIADALHLALHGARPVADQLIDALHDRALLLVIDNVEHLLAPDDDALPVLFTRLLVGAPHVRLLVTSRERLRLRDEWVLELGGLSVPRVDQGPRVEQADSVRLFVDRAKRVAPAFAINSQLHAAVAQICRRLEGMPLAIELAATWVRALSPAEIAAEIDRALDLLTMTPRDMPARHQSMRAVLDHSWNLLDHDERCTLARLSVFRGGCDREAARSITGATLPTITALLDKSLLRAEMVDGATRYRLHELVRQYAAERLVDDPAEHHATEDRHTQYYAALIAQSIDTQTGGSTPENQAMLSRNIDNLRAAWARATATHNVAMLGTMMRAFWLVYDQHSWLHDGVILFARAADALRDVEGAAVVRGYLLGLQGYFLTRIARYHEARTVAEEGLALLQANNVTEGLAAVMLYYGTSLCHVGQLHAAHDCFTRAAQLATAANDYFVQLWADMWLAVVTAFWGDYESAERSVTGCLAAFRGYGYGRGEGSCLAALGEIVRCRGQFDQAATYLHEGMRVGSHARDTLTICTCLCQLGALALHQGEVDEARYSLLESATLGREMGDQWLVGRALTFLVRVEIARNDVDAARLACSELTRIALDGEAMLVGDAIFGFALLLHHTRNNADAWGLLHVLGRVDTKAEIKLAAAELTSDLEQLLDRTQQAAAVEAARTRAIEPWLRELVARTFVQPSVVDPIPRSGQTPGVHVPATGETLSAREVDVLRLLAGGANNAQIAQHLIISLHTVKTHVAHILAKLNVASRTAAAVRARELGLV